MKKNFTISTAIREASCLLMALALVTITFNLTSCRQRPQAQISGHVKGAADNVLYMEQAGLQGPVVMDSVKLGTDGAFAFSVPADSVPEFYRLRIMGEMIHLVVDTVTQIKVEASYPDMMNNYEVSGSKHCMELRELSCRQMQLQSRINELINESLIAGQALNDTLTALLSTYKDNIKRDFIYKDPARLSSYFALFQTFKLPGGEFLIFDPKASQDDIKALGAVATAWDLYYPNKRRTVNLHNIAVEGLKNTRILKARQQQTIDASKVTETGIIDLQLKDNNGVQRRLTDLKGSVVLLDFHLFASEKSAARIMTLRSLYEKYHKRGLEIYQVSVDKEEHFWKTQTQNLPWVSVRTPENDPAGILMQYNIRQLPTYFLIDRNNILRKRDIQVKDIEAEINSML